MPVMVKTFLLMVGVCLFSSGYTQVATANDVIKTLLPEPVCGKRLVAESIDSFFLNRIITQLQDNETWLFGEKKSVTINLAATEKHNMIQWLNSEKAKAYTDTTRIENSQIVHWDSSFLLRDYMDKICLQELKEQKKWIPVVFISNPFFMEAGKSLVIYELVAYYMCLHDRVMSISYSLMLYHNKKGKWIKQGDLFYSNICF